jgi:hypothetical protein
MKIDMMPPPSLPYQSHPLGLGKMSSELFRRADLTLPSSEGPKPITDGEQPMPCTL